MESDLFEILAQLDDVIDQLEEGNVDDSLHVVLELGYQFRDELAVHCE